MHHIFELDLAIITTGYCFRISKLFRVILVYQKGFFFISESFNVARFSKNLLNYSFIPFGLQMSVEPKHKPIFKYLFGIDIWKDYYFKKRFILILIDRWVRQTKRQWLRQDAKEICCFWQQYTKNPSNSYIIFNEKNWAFFLDFGLSV